MIQIPEKTIPAFHSQTILSLNKKKILTAKSSQTILQLNQNPYVHSTTSAVSSSRPVSNSTVSASKTSNSAIPNSILQNSAMPGSSTSNLTPSNTMNFHTATHLTKTVSYKHPTLTNTAQKGQKTALFTGSVSPYVDVLLGWNVKNPACDVDVSAFLLGANQKVPGDSWFVFYGQPQSPDNAVSFETISANQCEKIHIQLNQLSPVVQKIVFVLTINEALTQNLNFSMIEDAYIQIVDSNHQELVSFPMSDYYESVTSMMIGEIYLHNGIWKFHAIGNGVKEDLAGLCRRYGVEVS